MQRQFKVKEGKTERRKEIKSEISRNQKREADREREREQEKARGRGGGEGKKKDEIRRVVVEGSAVCQISIRRH